MNAMKVINSKFRKSLLFCITSLTLVVSPNTHAIADAVLSFDVVAGNFRILDWSLDSSSPGTAHVGSGSGGGLPSFGDLTMQTNSNLLTVRLMSHLTRGQPIPVATLVDGNLSIEMRNVFVTGLFLREPDMHGVVLNFEEFVYTTNGESYCWNIPSNRQC